MKLVRVSIPYPVTARRMALRRTLLIVAFFALLSLIVLAPLTLHLGSWVEGQIDQEGHWDYFIFHWNLWWMRHAVLTGQDPYTTNMVLAPYTHNLAYHTLAPVWLPVYMVLEPLIGHLAAANTILPLAFTLAGTLMAAFLRRQGTETAGALVGGVAFAFTPYMLDHAASDHLNLIGVFWMPLALLLWDRIATTRRIGWVTALGVAAWGMWLTDPLVLLWAALLLTPYAVLALVRAETRSDRTRLVVLGALAALLALALAYAIAPLRQMLAYDADDLVAANDYTLRAYSLPLKALVVPGAGDLSLGRLLIPLVIAGLLVRRRPRVRWFWLLAALPPLVLALGPEITLAGATIPLPFRLVFDLTEGQLRTPARFTPPAVLGLITFVALTFDPWLRRLRSVSAQSLVTGALAVAFLWDAGALSPFPSAPAPRAYDIYAMMGEEDYPDYDYVVIDVPSGPFSGWREIGSHADAQFYATTHHKRTVSGMLARFAPDKQEYYVTSPLFAGLTGAQMLGTGPDIGELTRIVDEWPVGYVVVHLNWLAPDRAQETLAFMNGHPSLCFVTVEDDVVLYRTTSHPKGCVPRMPPESASGDYTLDLGVTGDEGFIGHGWYAHEDVGGVSARWAGGEQEALLYAHLPVDGSDYTLTMRVTAFDSARTVKVVANGTRLGDFTAASGGWSEQSVTIPADVIASVNGDLILSLSADGMVSASDLGLSTDTRPLTLAYDWARFTKGGE
jgi:hypothetical protein